MCQNGTEIWTGIPFVYDTLKMFTNRNNTKAMTLIRYNNGYPRFFTVPRRDDVFKKEIDQWFENNRNFKQSLPAVNVKETEDGYELEVAVPGMNKSDFKVEFDHDVLTISSEKEHKNEEEGKDGKYTKREFRYQSFKRSFLLPEGKVDGEKIQARYENGILYLNLPKKEEAKPKPARLIKVA